MPSFALSFLLLLLPSPPLLFGPSFPPTPRALNTPCNNQRKKRHCICFRLLPTLPHLMNPFRLVDK